MLDRRMLAWMLLFFELTGILFGVLLLSGVIPLPKQWHHIAFRISNDMGFWAFIGLLWMYPFRGVVRRRCVILVSSLMISLTLFDIVFGMGDSQDTSIVVTSKFPIAVKWLVWETTKGGGTRLPVKDGLLLLLTGVATFRAILRWLVAHCECNIPVDGSQNTPDRNDACAPPRSDGGGSSN